MPLSIAVAVWRDEDCESRHWRRVPHEISGLQLLLPRATAKGEGREEVVLDADAPTVSPGQWDGEGRQWPAEVVAEGLLGPAGGVGKGDNWRGEERCY